MKAVEVRGGRAHWVYDDQQTLCGRFLIDLPVVREFDTPELAGDTCQVCVDLATSGGLLPAAKTTLPPSFGVLRIQGPLSHGPRSKGSGRRLQGSE